MQVGNKISELFQLRKAFREMSRLDDATLKDLGVSRSEIKNGEVAEREAATERSNANSYG